MFLDTKLLTNLGRNVSQRKPSLSTHKQDCATNSPKKFPKNALFALSLVHAFNISLVPLPLVFLRTIRVFSVGLPNKSQQIRSPCVLKPRSPTHTISKRYQVTGVTIHAQVDKSLRPFISSLFLCPTAGNVKTTHVMGAAASPPAFVVDFQRQASCERYVSESDLNSLNTSRVLMMSIG